MLDPEYQPPERPDSPYAFERILELEQRGEGVMKALANLLWLALSHADQRQLVNDTVAAAGTDSLLVHDLDLNRRLVLEYIMEQTIPEEE